MSRIDDLINELCPHGVMYKKLCDIGFLYGGLSGKSKNDFQNGNAKYVTYMNIYSNISLNLEISEYVKIEDNEKQNSIQMGDILFTGSSETPDECGISSVVCQEINDPIYLNSFCFGFRPLVDMLIPDFSKHLFRSDAIRNQIGKTANGVTRFNISKKLFNQIEIPVPPLEVQNEIVRILDNFSALEAELEAELEARTIQYKFYRNQLLDFSNFFVGIPKIDSMLIKLCPEGVAFNLAKNLFEIKRGKRVVKKELNDNGEFPVYQNKLAPMGYYGEYNVEGETTYLISAGAAGQVGFSVDRFWAADDCIVFTNPKAMNNKFMYYFLQTQQDYINSNIRKASVPRLSRTLIENILTPTPPMVIQNEIVRILDNFSVYVSSLTEGLPAEIKARREQYEYYRNKLLTF